MWRALAYIISMRSIWIKTSSRLSELKMSLVYRSEQIFKPQNYNRCCRNMTQNYPTPAQVVSQQLVQNLARELKDLVLDYVLPGSLHDVMEIWNHRFLRFLECMEAYLDEPSESKQPEDCQTPNSIWTRLDTGKNLPLDRWYLDPGNVAADTKVYDLMKAEVFRCLKFVAARRAAPPGPPELPLLPNINLDLIPHLDPIEPRRPEDLARPIRRITAAVKWWRGTNEYGKFTYWSKYVQLPFHIYKQMRPAMPKGDGEEECLYENYLFDVGPLYGVREFLEIEES